MSGLVMWWALDVVEVRLGREMRTAGGESISTRRMLTVPRWIHLVKILYFRSDTQKKMISNIAVVPRC